MAGNVNEAHHNLILEKMTGEIFGKLSEETVEEKVRKLVEEHMVF